MSNHLGEQPGLYLRIGRGLIGAGLCVLAAGMMPVQADQAPGQYAQRADVRTFAAEAAQKSGVPQAEIQQWLDDAHYQQSIVDAMNRPAESKTWAQYRPIFMTPKRIEQGVAFWDEHEDLLNQMAQKYGVSPAIIVAIVGVETFYGQRMGSYRVIDALATLGFDYPKRGAFFRGQLIDFFKMASADHLNINDAVGSYAGAVGMPQFIPSSYLAYAIDGDGDGRADLWHSPADVFASVANYFAEHGWVHDGPVGFPIDVTTQQSALEPYLNTGRDLTAKVTVGQLRAMGIALPKDLYLPDQEKVMVFTLTGPDKVEYWVGLKNFYVITRYNHSTLYAMAVWQLSQAVAAAREQQADSTAPTAPQP